MTLCKNVDKILAPMITKFLERTMDDNVGFRKTLRVAALHDDLKIQAVKERNYFVIEVHGKRLLLTKGPLFLFSADLSPFNSMREMAVWVVMWKWFDRLILFTIMANLFTMVLPASYDSEQASPFENDLFRMANLTCIIIFVVECVLKIIARGLICGDAPDHCYLGDFSNCVDFIIVILSVIEVVLLGEGTGRSKMVMARFVRILRPLKKMARWPHLQLIVRSLIESMPRLAKWLVTVAFICLVFALCGENLFGTVYWHRCRLTEEPIFNNATGWEWPVDPDQTRFCGGRYVCRPTATGQPTFCKSIVTHDGVTFGIDPAAELAANPDADYGYTGFQTFSAAFLTVFQVATMEGWTDILHRFQDGRDSMLAMIFVVALVIFSGLILLNLVLGVLWASFENEIALQAKKNAVPKEPFPPDIMNMKLGDLVMTVNEIKRKNKEKEQRAAYDSSAGGLAVVRSICFSVVTQPSFDVFMLCVISLNCAVLAIDSHPPLSDTLIEIKQRVNLMCTLFFTGEAGFKIFSLGFKFFDEYLNIADLTLVVAGLVELFLGGSGIILALRVSRLLRLLKMMSQSVHVTVLLRVTQKASFLTLNFMALVVAVVLGCGIMGLQMFYEFEEPTDADQMQFSSFPWSFIIVFALLTGEHWNSIMINRARKSGEPGLVVAYFVSCFIFLHLILMNLFLGMFVAAFASSRAEVIDAYRETLREMKISGKDKVSIRPSPVVLSHTRSTLPGTPREEPGHAKGETSPLFPRDVWRNYPKGPVKSYANEMNVLRMMQIKQSAGVRAERIVLVPADEMRLRNSDRTRGRPHHLVPGVMTKAPPEATSALALPKQLATEVKHQCPPPPSFESSCGNPDVEVPPTPPARYLQEELHRMSPPGSARGLGLLCSLPRLDLDRQSMAHGSSASERFEAKTDNQCLRHSESFEGKPANQGLRHRFALQRPAETTASFGELYARFRMDDDTKTKLPNIPVAHEEFNFSLPTVTPAAAGADCSVLDAVDLTAAVEQYSLEQSGQRNSGLGITALTPRIEQDDTEELTQRNDSVLSARDHDSEAPAPFSICIHTSESHSMAPPAEITPAEPPSEEQEMARRKKQSALRRCCLHICSSPIFEPTVLVLIVISSIALAVDTPYLDPDSKLKQLLNIVEQIVSLAFLGEMLFKMCAFGLFNRDGIAPNGYFRSNWNLIDFIIVTSSIVDFIAANVSSANSFLKLIRVMRLLRTLRPLRLITRNKGLKIIVESLICSLPTLARAVAISLLFYVGFGILFMNLLKGELWRCSLDPTGTQRPEIVTKEDCSLYGGEWVNAQSNFDNFGHSIATVMHLGTGEGWLDVLVDVVNSVGVDMQPRKNTRLHYAALIILFVWIGAFFLVNLLIGVLTDQYQVTKDVVHGTELLLPEQRRWLDVQERLFANPGLLKPIWHVGGLFMNTRMLLSNFIDTRAFEVFIIVCICANTAMLTIEVPTNDGNTKLVMDWIGFIFLIIFNVELCLKLFIYFTMFFNEPWNVFDTMIIVVSDIGWIVARFMPADSPLVGLLDMARIIRCIRLVRICTFLRNYCKTMLQLLPALCNVSLLLILLLFIYACLGIGLFATIAPGNVLGEEVNFKTFGNSMMLVLRVTTGEDWQKLMYDTVLDNPGCTTSEQTNEELERDGPNGCGSFLGYPYFISFTSFVSIVLMNIIIAVILEGFQAMEQIESYEIYLQEVKLAAKAWLRVDYKGRGYLTLQEAAQVMATVPLPVGFQGLPLKKVTHRMRYLPIYDGRVHFRDIVVLSAKRVFCWTNRLPEDEACNVKIDDRFFARWCNFYPDVPRPDRGIDSFLVGHVLVKNFIDIIVARRKKSRRIRLAEAYITEQMADAQPLRKTGVNKATSNLKQAEAAQAAGGRNAAGLLNPGPADVCLPVCDQVGRNANMQPPSGSRPSPFDFDPPPDPEIEDRPFGANRGIPGGSLLPWPPPTGSKGIRPQDRLQQQNSKVDIFMPVQEVGLVGSGFDLP